MLTQDQDRDHEDTEGTEAVKGGGIGISGPADLIPHFLLMRNAILALMMPRADHIETADVRVPVENAMIANGA